MIVEKIRGLLWHLLGVDYHHILTVIDSRYAKRDVCVEKGEHSYINRAVVYSWGEAGVKIGKYFSVADGVKFIVDDGRHQWNEIATFPFPSNEIGRRQGIVLGNDVWVGMDAILLPGVHVGDGAVIAAGAVVTHDVEPYTVMGGIPARIVKRRCTPHQAEQMQRIAWWNWDEKKLSQALPDFKLDFENFIDKHI